MPSPVSPPTPIPGIWGSLFQASKAHLAPFARAMTSFLEIIIITVVLSGGTAIGDYATGHPNDISGLLPFVLWSIGIALGKAAAAFSPQLLTLQQQALVGSPAPPASTPPSLPVVPMPGLSLPSLPASVPAPDAPPLPDTLA